ncbi:hypothetical protein D1007_04287 [Hordeum vulgare]|uniref:Predicted protein n=1 Tax=Hordeum vulgare subsp. vulgare TaxID=112509 RepID=F2E5I3_HORVV|nr:uncharacterized protein LOC123411278 [Hordeum vulgare subsp. vulgare]KAE8817935.1 hypothetical protein D1007_04287 [Hordeum vulgare]BAK02605.1 predicted protein [Hordeum vulgare subsp. vulgare]BAK04554.1 predicted protein [Hordeum vulgare subsp. vulgare]
MGAGVAMACFLCVSVSRRGRAARLVLWGGEARAAKRGTQAGQVMLDFAGTVVCLADGFYIGRPAPVLAIEDRLVAGATYLVLPVDRLPQGYDAVTAASLAALSYDKAGPAGSIAGGPRSPFEYVKGDDGRRVIKVTPEFLVKAVTARPGCESGAEVDGEGACGGALCSTPELRKHYEQLVGSGRGRAWSPRLDTIKERKGRRLVAAVSPGRMSPVAVRLLGLGKGEGRHRPCGASSNSFTSVAC